MKKIGTLFLLIQLFMKGSLLQAAPLRHDPSHTFTKVSPLSNELRKLREQEQEAIARLRDHYRKVGNEAKKHLGLLKAPNGFHRIPGSLHRIAVGGNNIWGISPHGAIYRRENVSVVNTTGTSWTKIPGGLTDISVAKDGSNAVWGVNAQQAVFFLKKLQRDDTSKPEWTHVNGTFKQISVGSLGYVWGISNKNEPHYSTHISDDQIQWLKAPNPPKTKAAHVSVGSDGTVWCAGTNNHLYKWNGHNAWTEPNKNARGSRIEVGDAHNVLVVGANNTIWKLKSGTDSQWEQLSGGALNEISIDHAGHIWGIGSDDLIYHHIPLKKGSQKESPGPALGAPAGFHAISDDILKDISIGDVGHVWGIGTGTKIMHRKKISFSHPRGNAWEIISGSAKQISTASDGTLWAISPQNRAYRFDGLLHNNPTTPRWTLMHKSLRFISTASRMHCWGIDTKNVVWRFINSKWQKEKSPPGTTARTISAGSDGTVWCTGMNYHLYKWNGTDWTEPNQSARGKTIDVGDSHNIIVIGADNTVWVPDGKTDHKWLPLKGGKLLKASISHEGHIWGIGLDGKAYSHAPITKGPEKSPLATTIMTKK